MFDLTAQQCRELSDPEPIAIDTLTRKSYVLVRQEVYDRFKTLLTMDDCDPDEADGSINEIMAEDDAKDPYLQGYQDYGKPA